MSELLKIGELASRAGVEKSTVQHYLREGLLPPPAKKPHRNMAYYSSDLVERIRLIKELQTRRHLPLSRIKTLLADQKGTAEIRAYLYSQDPSLEPGAEAPTPEEQLLSESGLSHEHLAELESMGFLRPERSEDGNGVMYPPVDVAIIHAIASMQQAGLNAKHGFRVHDMAFYMDAMRAVILQELSLFTRVMGKLPRAQILDLARSGLEGTNSLILALRRKVLLDVLGGEWFEDKSAPKKKRVRK